MGNRLLLFKKICLRIFHSYREEYGLESELIIVNVISDESKRKLKEKKIETYISC